MVDVNRSRYNYSVCYDAAHESMSIKPSVLIICKLNIGNLRNIFFHQVILFIGLNCSDIICEYSSLPYIILITLNVEWYQDRRTGIEVFVYWAQ